MNRPTRTIVIVGGGTAGWLAANRIAAELPDVDAGASEVVLIESPDVPTIGVGEGTWPSMRGTLQRIGLAEDEFIRACDASFKQGTCFLGWARGGTKDTYYHPFSLPAEYTSLNPARYWLAEGGGTPFAEQVTPQAAVIAAGKAPRQVAAPQYAFTVNYAYHLDAGRFATLLARNAVDRLGVRHVSANVVEVTRHADGDIAALRLDTDETLPGDLFVDCTGQRALLIEGAYGRRLASCRGTLFNDRAIAVQVPHGAASADVPSATRAAATSAGWIWDIALGTRRGLGHVYSSAHEDEEAARAMLGEYVRRTSPGVDPEGLTCRTIAFEPGYRLEPWTRNCVAVGLSAGFVEPLEASALALVEQAAAMIGEQLPRDRQIMEVVARRFNARMRHHWERIVEFLKLHYAIGGRDEPYWSDHRAADSCPDTLREKLTLWRQQPPWHDDAPRVDELFPSASYQYVLYGMGFRPRYTDAGTAPYRRMRERADQVFHEVRENGRKMVELLPTNRQLLCAIAQRAA